MMEFYMGTFRSVLVHTRYTIYTATYCCSNSHFILFAGKIVPVSSLLNGKDTAFSMRKHSNPLPLHQDIRPMRDQIVRVKRFEKVPLILVGNKVDLESEREVAGSDGRALAQEWGCPFIETSAKSKTMVDELFAEIVRQMNYSTLPEKQEQCCTACVVQ